MISLTLTVDKLTAISYITNPKVLETFKIHVLNEVEAEIEGKSFYFSKTSNLQDVEYTFIRKGFLRKQVMSLKFSILARKDRVTISITGDKTIIKNFDEKKFLDDMILLDTERKHCFKTL